MARPGTTDRPRHAHPAGTLGHLAWWAKPLLRLLQQHISIQQPGEMELMDMHRYKAWLLKHGKSITDDELNAIWEAMSMDPTFTKRLNSQGKIEILVHTDS